MTRPKQTQVPVVEEVIPVLPKLRVRDRIMKTATDLFYRQGIHAVGVDTIASEAGTNKMSFYRNFASKDELVAEYLRGEEREGWLWWDETLAAHAGNPRLQVESLFDILVENTCEDDSRGCALANAAVEITEPEHPARPVIEKYKAEMRRRFHQLARAMHARDPEVLGDSLMLLWEGAYLARVTMGQHGPVQGAAKAARALIAAYTD
jgi:AcrR family transcriptional regulator